MFIVVIEGCKYSHIRLNWFSKTSGISSTLAMQKKQQYMSSSFETFSENIKLFSKWISDVWSDHTSVWTPDKSLTKKPKLWIHSVLTYYFVETQILPVCLVLVKYHQRGNLEDRDTYLCLPKLFLLTQRTDEVCLRALHLTASSVTGFEARLSFQMFGLRLQISESNKE